MQRKRAFTLIELLVVIAIIAILAAILFPVFAKARERAKQSKSLNNIRQIAIGITSYATDYGDALPGWVDNSSTGAGQYAHNTWDEQIDPNIKSKDVYNNGDSGIRSEAQPNPHTRVLTYGLNGLLIAPAATFTGNPNFTVSAASPPSISTSSSVSNPAGTILLAELQTSSWTSGDATSRASTPIPATGTSGAGTASSAWTSAASGSIDISPKAWVDSTGTNASYYDTAPTPYGTYSGWGVARDLYGGGGSYAFMDGHVKFMKLPDTVGMGKSYGTSTVSASNAWNTANTNNMWNPASGG